MRLIHIIVIPKLDKLLAKFFTLLYSEQEIKPPTFIRVYKPDTILYPKQSKINHYPHQI